MNLLGKGTISAVLFAATASVICAAPAQALSLTGVHKLEFGGFAVDITASGLDFYTTSSATDDDSLGTTSTFWGAKDSSDVSLGWSQSVGSIKDTSFGTGLGLTDFLSFILSTGQTLSFDLDSAALTSDDDVLLSGLVKLTGADGGSKQYFGQLESASVLNGPDGSYSITLTDVVPTPAAVLPVLGGLLGMASKRKHEEEENA